MKPGFSRKAHAAMRIFSMLFAPLQGTFVVFLVLFFFTYLIHIPLAYRLFVLLFVYLFTILLPTLGLYLYRRFSSGDAQTMFRNRRKRLIPYLIVLLCYVVCYLLMQKINLPRYMYGIVIGTSIAIALSGIANFRWKVSEHLISMGGAVACILIFSVFVGHNPLFLLSIAILVSGLLGSSRIILKHHTLGEVLLGFFIGFFSLFCALNYYV